MSRSRDPITESEVLEELEIAKNMLSCLAVMTGATIMHIQNTEGKADKAALIAATALGVN
jgi:adenylate kinase